MRLSGAANRRYPDTHVVSARKSTSSCGKFAAGGTTSGDRMVSGAGIGAGAGAVLGAVTGMGPGTGAAIGAAAGAATGGLTNKKQINLGKPVWR